MTEALSEQERGLLELSVDEIFTKHSVHAVQSLHKNYKASVTKSKNELHSLVGQKYRDLIRIAEDIDRMTSMSMSIDGQLASLSYRPPNSVSFGKDKLAKFDSLVRKQHAASARSRSQKTVLNNIINDQLISFDLKLKRNALKGTSKLVYMAKVYRTISQVFGPSVAADPYHSQHFLTLKSSFVEYLETKIASVAANDPTGESLKKTAFHTSKTQKLESDNIDFLSEFDSDTEADGISDSESHESITKKTFGGASSPIINYLMAYILISYDTVPEDITTSVAQKVLELRYQHLRAVLSSPSASINNVNFPAVLKFVESTLEYVQKFLLDSSSEVIRQLRNLLPWKASDVLGFTNWLDEKPIVFELPQLSHKDIAELPGGKVQVFLDLIQDLFSRVWSNGISSDRLVTAEKLMGMLYNFLSSMRKSEMLALINDVKAYTIDALTQTDFATKLSEFVLQKIGDMVDEHHNDLARLIPTTIDVEFLKTLQKQKYPYELCTNEFVDIIDHSVEQYFNRLVEATTMDGSKSSESDTVSKVQSWFYQESELLKDLTIKESDILHRISETLQRKYGDEDTFEKWGSFSQKSFESKCGSVREETVSKLKEKLGAVVDQLSAHVNGDFKSISKTHFLLKLYLVLKSNITNMIGPSEFDSKIDDRISSLFDQIFDHISTSILFAEGQFSEFSSSDSLLPGFDSATIPTRPNILVHSSLEQLASEFLNSEVFTQDEMFDLYSSKGSKHLYVEAKNRWVKESLIKKSLIDKTGAHIQTSATQTDQIVDDEVEKEVEAEDQALNGDTKAEPSKALIESRQLLANTVFALNLVSSDGISAGDSTLKEAVESLKTLGKTGDDELAVDVVVRGVNEFYKSSRDIYYPLSMN